MLIKILKYIKNIFTKKKQDVYVKEERFDIVNEMFEARKYCSLILKARAEAGFNSVKYPITDVKINRYFTPELREVISEECNLVGYMDIPAVENIEDYGKRYVETDYHYSTDGNREVWLSTTRTQWQEDIYNQRLEARNEAVLKKEAELA